MSQEQMAELATEKSRLSSEDMSDETMLMKFEIRFWKQRAWRAEQQRDQEIAARKATEVYLERYKGIPQESLDGLRLSLLTSDLARLKNTAMQTLGLYQWTMKCQEESAVDGVQNKIHFWADIISATNTLEDE